jgi:hypothetical protein
MKTILAVAVMAVLVSLIVVSTLVVTDNNVDASSSDSVVAAVCGPDAIHLCQTI